MHPIITKFNLPLDVKRIIYSFYWVILKRNIDVAGRFKKINAEYHSKFSWQDDDSCDFCDPGTCGDLEVDVCDGIVKMINWRHPSSFIPYFHPNTVSSFIIRGKTRGKLPRNY